MKHVCECIYMGTVVHKRLVPCEHVLRYSVFSCLFDCARLEELDARLRLFSYNRFNLFSLYDGDHTQGESLWTYLQNIAGVSGRDISRFMMLCYPRVLGYAFNPVTVYFGLGPDDQVRLIIYEVRNTFGQRQTYVLPAEPDAQGLVNQECRKRLYVSPFNGVDGRYSFHVSSLKDTLTVGVALKRGKNPVLKAHFHGTRRRLSDVALLAGLSRTGWLTLKVIAGIHFEALKLWLKGMRVVPRPAAPAVPIAYISSPKENR